MISTTTANPVAIITFPDYTLTQSCTSNKLAQPTDKYITSKNKVLKIRVIFLFLNIILNIGPNYPNNYEDNDVCLYNITSIIYLKSFLLLIKLFFS